MAGFKIENLINLVGVGSFVVYIYSDNRKGYCQ
jgi:hypothetical protein